MPLRRHVVSRLASTAALDGHRRRIVGLGEPPRVDSASSRNCAQPTSASLANAAPECGRRVLATAAALAELQWARFHR
jgi:hypothetical protein